MLILDEADEMLNKGKERSFVFEVLSQKWREMERFFRSYQSSYIVILQQARTGCQLLPTMITYSA